MTDPKDRIALVTGASRGLGFATAVALGAAGCHVIALARTVGGLEELDEAVRAAGGEPATLVPLDITDDPGLERLGAAVHGRWGHVDIWVHTAAHAVPLSPAGHIDEKDFGRALAVNVCAFQRLIRVVEPLLLAAPDPVAVISAGEHAGEKFFGAHGAAKAAQGAIAAAWAAERAGRIAVHRVEPPPMPTALRARFHPGEDRARLTPPAEAAKMILELIVSGAEPAPGICLLGPEMEP